MLRLQMGLFVRASREFHAFEGIVRACLLGAAIWVVVAVGLWF
jgi:hypothetical protein